MTQPSGSARVLSVIQELRQLRDKVCILSEKNRALAKALTGVKQELTKARAAQTAMFSDKVTEWMETRCKTTEVQHRSIQCNIKELDQDTCATVGANLEPEPEPEPSYSPCWSARAIRLSQSTPRVSVSAVSYNRAPAIFACTKVIDRAIEENASTVESGDEDMTKAVAMTDSTTNNRQYAYVNSSSDRAGSQRQLRQRDTNMSYAEPKLNTKLRRGDYYGLGNRPIHRLPKPCVISGSRGAKSAIVPARFGQCSPFRRRPTTRTAKRVSYVEPKLNTKLRQGDKFTFTT